MLRDLVTLLRPKLVRLFPADENIWFHRQVAYSMAFWTVVHTTAHYANFFNVELTRKSPAPPSCPSPLPRQRSAQRLPSTFTTPRLAESPATLCSSSCCSFTHPLIAKFVTSASRLFGTLTTSPSSSSSLSTRTLPVASSAIPSIQTTSHPSLSTPPNIVSATRVGGSPSGQGSLTFHTACTANTAQGDQPGFQRSSFSQTV